MMGRRTDRIEVRPFIVIDGQNVVDASGVQNNAKRWIY
jgi:hypothetical protein